MKNFNSVALNALVALGGGVCLIDAYAKAKKQVSADLKACGKRPDTLSIPLWREESAKKHA